MKGLSRRRGLAALACALACAACGDEPVAPPEERPQRAAPAPETTLARERAAASFQRFDFAAARAALAPLVEGEGAAGEDLVRAAAVEFALHEAPRAAELLERAAAAGADPARVAFLRGRMALERGDMETAVGELRRASEAAPEDLAARLALATALQDDGRYEEAEALYRTLVEVGFANGEAWYLAALYRLQQMLRGTGREEAARPFVARWQELAEAGVRLPGEALQRLGNLGWVRPPAPSGSETVPTTAPPRVEVRRLELSLAARAVELAAHDLDGDGRMELLARTPDGVVVARRGADGWSEERVFEREVALARAFDLDNDLDLELALFTAGGLVLLQQTDGAFAPLVTTLPELPAVPSDALALDYDHEGDLDLLLVGPFGARLWRNDGAWVAGGAFVDVTEEAGLPRGGDFTWVLSEDFDGDSDVDLLLGGPGAVFLADNLRGGRFGDASGRFDVPPRVASRPIVADFDADGRPDLRGREAWWWQTSDGALRRAASALALPAQALAFDLDLDGALDLVGPAEALLAAGLPQEARAPLEGWPKLPVSALAAAELDGEPGVDVALATGEELLLLRNVGASGAALPLRLSAAKDNRRAVGAVVELRAGPIYRRVYYRGEPMVLGLGPFEQLDVLRVIWPNGLVQTALDRALFESPGEVELDPALGDIAQQEGLIGSCPFLYTWDGARFVFVSDVLGITPLGLPMAPGQLVPFDHDEYVLVKAEELRARDGWLELAITEELREVTYLDRVRLDVLDHPADTEVFPNERFTFPPFPEPHVHTVRAALAPVSALGSDGRDWAVELAREDAHHAVPFERQPPQFQGLATPWTLELAFEREQVQRASKLRLVMTGWFYWTNASVNVAAARHPGVDFVPPILSVPDGEGGWRELGPPVGFPAGKTKTMVLELDPADLAPDPRLRVFSTLQLYWDRIALVVDDDDAELRVHELEPVSAELWERGFSARIETGAADQPERFDWDALAPHPRWDQHPGLYTRLGDCVELLGAIDDRYVILGAGDALTIRFDARALPPVPAGFRRDYLLFLDGWAKDRDPNTHEALEVEPLPFHGMSSYPYPASERFPDDEAHERWRREWNTRPARRWIPTLAPQ